MDHQYDPIGTPTTREISIRRFPCGQNNLIPSPSHHHFYRWYKLFPVTGGKNDIVLPTSCHIQLLLGLSTTINHYQPLLTTINQY